MSRLGRERKTIAVMVRLYCRDHHWGASAPVADGQLPDRDRAATSGQGLCAECEGLLAYAGLRLDRCRFGEDKPTCAHCTVHCFARTRREQIRAVMRYSGPRMTACHPVLAIAHLLDSVRNRRVSKAR